MDDALSLWSTAGRHSQLALQGLRVATHALRGGGHAESLAHALGQLRGPVVKMAQFLSTLPGVLPPDYTDALAKLQSHAPSMPPLFVKRRMATELGPHWQSCFDDFDMQPSYAASLGQVHRASLHNGQMVACKLQYPRMDHVIETDLQQLQWWLGMYNVLDGTIDHTEILKEIRSHLAQELDYTLEKQNMRLFAEHYNHLMVVPDVVENLSTNKLLTMAWHDGRAIWDAPSEIVAEQLFRAWYTPFYNRGWLHSDPHPGNYCFDDTCNKLVVFDFGCVRYFEPSFVQGVRNLYLALQRGISPIHALETWGFTHINNALVDALMLWAQILFEPLLDDRKRQLYDNLSDVQKRMENVYKALRVAGGVRPPREFVLMDRTALGLGGVLTRLQASLNWHRLFEEVAFGTEFLQA